MKVMNALNAGMLQEALMAARFCAVGILSTAVHLTVALSLVVFAGTDAVVANCSAFLCAFLVSFFGHFHWTFNKRSARARSFVRFAGIALASLAANNLVLIGLIDVANTARECAVLTAVLVVLPVTYLSNRLWGFSDLESGRPLASNGAAWPSYLSALALGALFAFWLFPADFILGESAYWSAPEGDPMAHVIGMRYFLADEWRFPLFQTRLIAPPEGVNIIFTDSLPLFALIAKLLRPWLSEQVNYFGIWYFSVYVLQAVAAVFLLRSLDVKSLLPNLAGTVLALSCPALIFRFGHTALCGHFLVLFALGLYFRSVRRAAFGRLWGWFALLCGLALLVHAYLFVMVFGVFAAAAVQEALSSRAGLRNGLIAGVVIAAECVLLMWISGYFHGAGANGGGGFGVYSMNLLSPWVPQLSGLFPAMDRVIDSTGGQYEGFNYLGFGILLLLGAALWAGRSEIPAALGRYWGLGGLLLGFAALAVTHRVFLGSWKLLEIDLDPPSFLQQLRSSGRFFWPVGYTLMALGVAVAARKMRRPLNFAVVLTAAALQFVDASPIRDSVAKWGRSEMNFGIPDQSWRAIPWRPLIAAHERLTIFPSFECSGPWDAQARRW
jgi:putative flippase GtrA